MYKIGTIFYLGLKTHCKNNIDITGFSSSVYSLLGQDLLSLIRKIRIAIIRFHEEQWVKKDK